MIVKRLWVKKENDGFGHVKTVRHREGWFLFGFIPLYIRDISYTENH